MSTIGGGCSTRSSDVVLGQVTHIFPFYSFPSNGVVTQACEYTRYSNITAWKIKIFRDDGTNFNLVGESSLTSAGGGTNTITGLNIAVQAGDIIGVYLQGSGSMIDATDGSSTGYYKSGDNGTSAKSGWASVNWEGSVSVQVTYNSTIDNVYINSSTGNDSNDGTSCVNAVLTFQTAYNLLNSAGTIYICNDGADFSGENITFTKPYNTAQGAAGVTNYKSPRFN